MQEEEKSQKRKKKLVSHWSFYMTNGEIQEKFYKQKRLLNRQSDRTSVEKPISNNNERKTKKSVWEEAYQMQWDKLQMQWNKLEQHSRHGAAMAF